MSSSKSYNGHRSYNAWNVSLWINNDEALYRWARECIHDTSTREQAADYRLEQLHEDGFRNTPDGVPYTVTNIRLAMREM